METVGGGTPAATAAANSRREPKPPWLKVRFPGGPNYLRLKQLMQAQRLHTVCEEAHCPNVGECWEAGTATFMILGDVCTRACGYCAVTSGRPGPLDLEEPFRVAQAVRQMGLTHAVITSVDRDDQADGGAGLFAETIRWIRRLAPQTTVEVLIPDFGGNWEALATVMAAQPEILNHNVETVPRLYRRARSKGSYPRCLELLRRAKDLDPGTISKTGMMVGLGETWPEISAVMQDLRGVGCEVLTIGQYLRPSEKHLPLARYYPPEEFDELRAEALALGFSHVESGPLVRSSYHAERQVMGNLRRRQTLPDAEIIPLMAVQSGGGQR
ncbi:MAG TPA: lipoyl synthase [Dehalococcoidia bacterium]|nr:lipoyl synthase [Dehalococcoidia bacterium]